MIDLLKYVPCNEIQEYIFEHSQPVHLATSEKTQLLARFTLMCLGQIPHFREAENLPSNVLTPFTLQIAYLLLQLFCRNLQAVQPSCDFSGVDVFTIDGYYALRQSVQQYQQDNNISTTGCFDQVTVEQLNTDVLQKFLREKVSSNTLGPKYVKDIYGYE